MQIGIASILIILLKMCDALFYRTCLFFYGIFWPLGLERIRKTAGRAQARLHRYQPAIKSAAVEFHKAQCFFMLSIGIAGQIVLRQRSLEDGSLQSLVNYTLVGIISVNGVVPVTMTFLCLHTVRMHSWYLLILSICTVVLSTTTLSKAQEFAPSAQYIGKLEAASNSTYPKCGYKDPSIFCLTDDYGLTAPSTGLAGGEGGWAVVFSLVILGLLVLEYNGLQELLIVQRFFRRIFGGIESLLKPKLRVDVKHSRLQRAPRDYTAHDYNNGLSNLLYLFIWTCYLVLFPTFLFELGLISPVDGWPFGQIVAISVWAAPIVEFLKLLVRKYIFCMYKPTVLTCE